MPLKPLATGQSGYIVNHGVARSWGNDWLAFGEACSRWNAKPKPEAPPSVPPPPWLEQHVRRRSALGIHQQHKHVKQERQSVKLASLQHQLSPHFLFNALNSVHWLWNRGDRNRAIESMEAFMALWHDHWNQDTEGWHGLTDEFASIKRYLLLESIRLDLPLNVEVCMPPEFSPESILVPKLFLQPIAENSIWHGFSPTPPAGTTPRIQIEATWEEGWATEWGVLASTSATTDADLLLMARRAKEHRSGSK